MPVWTKISWVGCWALTQLTRCFGQEIQSRNLLVEFLRGSVSEYWVAHASQAKRSLGAACTKERGMS